MVPPDQRYDTDYYRAADPDVWILGKKSAIVFVPRSL